MTNNKSLIHRNMTFNDTFQSSLVQKNNEKFTMDKSLIKGIKQNDVSKIVDKNQLSSGTQNKQFYDQYKQVEGIVLETRKRYDNQKSKTLKCEQQIQKLKIQKQKLTEENNKLTQTSENNKRKFEETNKKLQQITTLMQSTIYKKDIFTNIRQNIKNDLVVFRKRYLDKDIKLLRQNSKLKSVKSQHQNKVSLSKRCREMLGSVEKNLHENQLSRTSKIQSFCQVLDRRQTAQQNRQIRQRQIQEAMISAMTDKLSQEKQWIKMLNSNLFLKSVLKSKMQRLMAKYNQIQLSFHKMKQATSLKNSNQFIEKFLSREETYGLLLEAISQKERELQQLKQEHAQLQRINQKYQYQGEEMTDQNKKKIIINPTLDRLEVKNPNTVLNQINQKLVQISRKRQLMYQWGVRFISAFKQHKNKSQVTKKFPKTKFKQLFLEVMSTINIFLKDLATQQNHEQKIKQAFMKNNPKQKFMTGQLLQKNRRVRTLSTLQHQGQGFDDKDMMYDDISQADYIQYNRRAVKKNDIQNRKFRIKTKPN